MISNAFVIAGAFNLFIISERVVEQMLILIFTSGEITPCLYSTLHQQIAIQISLFEVFDRYRVVITHLQLMLATHIADWRLKVSNPPFIPRLG